VTDEVRAFLRRDHVERQGDEFDDLVEAARARGAEQGFQFRKRELDRIEIGTVGRQKSQVRPRVLDRGPHGWLFVDDEVIEHDHVAGAERRHEHLFDVREKGRIVEGAVEHGGGVEAVHAQRGDDRVCLPVTARRVIAEPQAARTAPIPPQEIRRDPGFVQEDVLSGIAERQPVLPAATCRRDVRPALFVRVYRFF